MKHCDFVSNQERQHYVKLCNNLKNENIDNVNINNILTHVLKHRKPYENSVNVLHTIYHAFIWNCLPEKTRCIPWMVMAWKCCGLCGGNKKTRTEFYRRDRLYKQAFIHYRYETDIRRVIRTIR